MYETRMLEEEYDLADPSGKSGFIKDVAARILRFEDPVERDNYVGLIAYKYDVSVDSLNEVIKKQAIVGSDVRLSPRPVSTRNDRNDIGEATRLVQSRLLSWVCETPEIYETVRQYISADDFADPLYRKVAEILFGQIEKGTPNPADIISMFTEEEEQRQIAEAFHQNVGNLESVAMKESALKDLMLNVKRLSLTRDDREDNDFNTIIRLRSQLEELERATIKLAE
jgi:DNA primase